MKITENNILNKIEKVLKSKDIDYNKINKITKIVNTFENRFLIELLDKNKKERKKLSKMLDLQNIEIEKIKNENFK